MHYGELENLEWEGAGRCGGRRGEGGRATRFISGEG